MSHIRHMWTFIPLYMCPETPPGLLLSTCEPHKLSQAIGSNHPSYSNPVVQVGRSAYCLSAYFSVRVMEGHTEAILSVSMDSACKTAVSGSDDETVRLYSPSSIHPAGHNYPVGTKA